MLNYLFYDNDTGESFFVQLENDSTVEDAWEVVREDIYGNAAWEDKDYNDIEYIDYYTDEEAEMMGYDTY